MKTSDLVGPALDWAVAQCEKLSPYLDLHHDKWATFVNYSDHYNWVHYTPTQEWGWRGSIIERERISLWARGNEWAAESFVPNQQCLECVGPTPLIAAMRCYVASKLGDDIDIPPEIA